jgi:hypothetical protein
LLLFLQINLTGSSLLFNLITVSVKGREGRLTHNSVAQQLKQNKTEETNGVEEK